MSGLPYLNPDLNDDLNLGLLLLLISKLGMTPRKKLLLNNERLLILMYLVKNPVILERVLLELGRESITLNDAESYSVNSIAVNLDPLFDNDWIKRLLKAASSRSFLNANYRKSEGFMYTLSETGMEAANKLSGQYFERVREYSCRLTQLNSLSNGVLNRLLNSIFRG
jgi:hypothetical protein